MGIQEWVCQTWFQTKPVSAGPGGCQTPGPCSEPSRAGLMALSWVCWGVWSLKSRLARGGGWPFPGDSQPMQWHPAASGRSAGVPTKQGGFMKPLSRWKTKWKKKKDYTTLLALLLPSLLNKSIYSIIKIFCCLLVETEAFSLQTHNSHSIFNNAQSFRTCSSVSAVRARDIRNEMCWIHSHLSSFYWIQPFFPEGSLQTSKVCGFTVLRMASGGIRSELWSLHSAWTSSCHVMGWEPLKLLDIFLFLV